AHGAQHTAAAWHVPPGGRDGAHPRHLFGTQIGERDGVSVKSVNPREPASFEVFRPPLRSDLRLPEWATRRLRQGWTGSDTGCSYSCPRRSVTIRSRMI